MPVDDFVATTATTGVVGIGGSATGNIETTGDADWFAVTLVAGTTYQFDLRGSDTGDGTLDSPQLELREPGGNLLLSDTISGGFDGPGSGWSSRITYTAPTSGTYYLASDPTGNAIGTYRVSATSLGIIADDYAATTSTTGAVSVGGSATGNIETTGDVDWFAVTLVAGTTYQFDLRGSDTGDGTLDSPQLDLRGSDGNLLLSDTTSGGFDGPGSSWSSRITYTATASGTYYLASDPLGNAIGTYRVSAASLGSIPDDYAATTVTTGTVSIGGSATGNIETTGDADWFAVTLVAGATYQFDLKSSDTGDGTLDSPQLELRGSGGNLLLSDSNSGGFDGPGSSWSSRITYTATASGTYYLASDPTGNEIGTYRISAASLGSIADDYAATASTTGAVSVGGSATGNIETTGDADWFAVTLVAGTTYQFDLRGSDTGDGTLEFPQLELRGSGGSFLLSDSTSGGFDGPGSGWSSRITYTAQTSGTYYLASDPTGNAIGTYRVSATSLGSIVDDYAATTSTTGVVSIGGSATGNIETTGDADWFAVTLVAGTTYQFDLRGSDTGDGTLDSPQLDLRGPGGNLLVSDSTSGGFDGPGSGWSSQITYTAPASGTYYLASDPTGSMIGTYRVSASLFGSNRAPTITSDGGTATASMTVGENTAAVTTVRATDPDPGTTLAYSITGGADAAKFQIDGATGALSLITAPDFEQPTDVGNDNDYVVRVSVSDGSLSDDQTLTVTVIDEPEAPSITSNGGGDSANVSVAEKTTAVTTVTATDQDAGTTLSYSIRGGPDMAHFQIDSVTGALSFIAAPKYARPTDVGENNSYMVTVQASDGTTFDLQNLIVDIANVFEPPTGSDFDGDGNSDVLWRHVGGQVTEWQMNGDRIAADVAVAAPGTEWKFQDTGDLGGDGHSDVMWRHTSGQVVLWQMNGSRIVSNTSILEVSNQYHVQGLADFNGDGKSDVLFRHDSGQVVLWQMDGDRIAVNTAISAPSREYHIEAVGDFGGDRKSDVMLRHDNGQVVMWQMDGDRIAVNTVVANVSRDYHVQGVGDFNGDGKSDVVWRHDSGQIVLWQMDGDRIVSNTQILDVSNQYKIQDVRDYNGDGMSDILLRHESGQVVLWQMNGDKIASNTAVAIVPTDWQIQAHHFDLL